MSSLAYFLIGLGVLFDLLGTLGLVRLPDLYNRLQAGTKCVTLGTCLILVGAAVGHASVGHASSSFSFTIRALLCAVFVLLTSPVAAHALARGSHLGGFKLWEKSVVDKYEEDADKVRQQAGSGGSA